MADQNMEILKKQTYLKAIENSIGSKLFSSLYFRYKDSGEITDILNDGEFSCAFFVSSILYLFQVIDKPHATVKSLLKIFSESADWQKIDQENIEAGDIVFYEKTKSENELGHAHVGFVLNKKEAISTSSKEKSVIKHPIEYRAIEAFYRFSWPLIN